MVVPPVSLSPEREKELIDKIAKYIVDYGMETPAILFLESVKPLAFVGGQLTLFYLAPFLPLVGRWGEEAITLLQSRENVERLLQRVEELIKEKEERPVQQPVQSTKEKRPLLQRIKKLIKRE
ncbi:MAG: hypothetical protein AOA65_0872 [Candidatus Bathyarchaeota archaeon BA1]|nr:MAG: hypothetical protein AOA65_0872 [Candidatus Bathyarchaeota archaeon BA1]